ncbi:MAG: MarR family EPS-associated transcriptional regulator, partial [Myxococcota bacterium]
MSATPSEHELPMLEALASEPQLSQRELARRLGLPLSRAHFILRRLIQKGMVKVHNVAESTHKLGYLYVLTPRGLEVRLRLTYSFLHRMAEQHRRMAVRVEALIDERVTRRNGEGGVIGVMLVGEGPLAQAVGDVVRL